MNFAHLLTPEEVLPDMSAQTKHEALVELARPLLARFSYLTESHVLDVLESRESVGTTAIGEGVAIPHGKMPGLTTSLLAVGRNKQGVEFGAADGKPCQIFFLILVPEGEAGQHLRLLAQIARRVKDPVFREGFLKAAGRPELWQFLTTF